MPRRRMLLVGLPIAACGLLLAAAALALAPAPHPTLDRPKRSTRPPRDVAVDPPPPKPAPKPVLEPGPRPAPEGVTEFGRGAWEQAHASDLASMRLLAKFYIDGSEGFPRALAEGIRWLEKGVALGDPACMLTLAQTLRSGPDSRRHAERAAALLLQAAELDFHAVFKHLALAYESGDGVPTDRAKALHWYDRHHAVTAVDDDFTRTHAASILLSGAPGVPRDVPAAMKLLEESAGAGNEEAMFRLGVMYRDGTDVPRDLVRARGLLEEAVKGGSERAAYVLQRLPAE